MVSSCAAIGCKSRAGKQSGFSFHVFPKHPKRREEWVEATRRKNYKPTTSSVLCSRHFKDEDYDPYRKGSMRVLRRDAVPSIFDFPAHIGLQSRKRLLAMGPLSEASPPSSDSCWIKEEPVELDEGEKPMDLMVLQPDAHPVKLEPDASVEVDDQLRGIHPLAASSYFVAINLSHGTKIKEERQVEVEFGFVDVGVDGVLPSDPSWVAEEDPLQLSQGVSPPTVWPPPLDCVKTEPPTWTESELAVYRPDNGLSSSNNIKLGLVPIIGPEHGEEACKPDPDKSACEECANTGEKTNACNICDTKFTFRSTFTKHKLLHTAEKPYACEICDANFTLRSTFTKHKLLHTGEKPYACDECGAKFTRNDNLTKHKQCHTGQKTCASSVCDAQVIPITGTQHGEEARKPDADKCANELTKHKQIHTGEKPYACDVCDAKFTRNDNLTKHMQCHTGQKTYACDVCDARFSKNGVLTIHKRRHTGEKPYSCNMCDSKFTSNSDLTIHKRYHTGEKPYACDVCGARFIQSGVLTKHKRRHTGEKPYACDVCDARFTHSSAVNKHKRRHTGEQPYSCDVCDVRFTQGSSLAKHKRIHTGEKPFPCDMCKAKFGSKSNLTAHKRCHTGEQPYACDLCDARFSQSSSLTKHKHLHTREKPFACNVCNSKFALKCNLTALKRCHVGEKRI